MELIPKIHTIAIDNDPILKMKAKEINLNEISSIEIQQLLIDMVATMKHASGIGLAAPQIHISKRIIVFYVPPDRDINHIGIDLTILINPIIIPINESEMNIEYEGCLSVPGLRGKVTRYNKIKYNGMGDLVEGIAEGWHARVIQHEIDHLDGILYTELLNQEDKLCSVANGKN